jgi:hypothetical protein
VFPIERELGGIEIVVNGLVAPTEDLVAYVQERHDGAVPRHRDRRLVDPAAVDDCVVVLSN